MNRTDLHIALRRDLHANPELAFAETRTAEIVASRLRQLGIEVATGIGGTGVVGTIRKGASGRAIAFRADMDALPIVEANAFAHASRTHGAMHACGHDGHVAMLLAAAEQLAGAAQFEGSLHLIFQPGEESGRGAVAMIEDGLFERFPAEAVFALHNWPGLQIGEFAVSPGPVMAACNEFRIEISGKGGHAAIPDRCVDPVLAATATVQALQMIVSRNVPPADTVALSVTTLEAGGSLHITPDLARIAGTVRTYRGSMSDFVEQRMRDIVAGTAAAHGCSGKLDFVRNCAATVNHATPAARVRAALEGLVGQGRVHPMAPAMTAEDFAFMLEAVPGAYFWIGNGEGDGRAAGHGLGPCTLHNPSYDFDDRLIPIGAAAWVAIAESWFSRP